MREGREGREKEERGQVERAKRGRAEKEREERHGLERWWRQAPLGTTLGRTMLTVGESDVEVAALRAVVKGVDEVMLRKRRLL